ncbi:hypothetical protein OG357_23655 [Streptomyces sp. NBC_01255]|uniref:hypothetical protein n=1 Tax=Streptomyces sp. NBC_01255 TaxID=2903798 RepID=UPI002E36AA88|nr:hypothetical protein [Streptomyces sp. NBC_01255]
MKSITLRMVTVLAVATVPLGLVGAAHAADSPQVKVSAVAADATKSGDAVVGTLVQDVRDLLGTGLTGKPKGGLGLVENLADGLLGETSTAQAAGTGAVVAAKDAKKGAGS